jgi:hypothetical protein
MAVLEQRMDDFRVKWYKVKGMKTKRTLDMLGEKMTRVDGSRAWDV